MKPGVSIPAVLSCILLAASAVSAQAPAATPPKPATPPASGNPFPEDTTTIPVMPNATTPPDFHPEASAPNASAANIGVPAVDTDPARSPDNPAEPSIAESKSESSSRDKELEKLLPNPDEEINPKSKKKQAPQFQETEANDIDVGKYYLEKKDWRAALSRFQSAMVLDPENPEVYWGMAEAAHHLGDYPTAKAYYQKLLDYDPDGPHGKAARKAMKEPEIANAQNAAQSKPK